MCPLESFRGAQEKVVLEAIRVVLALFLLIHVLFWLAAKRSELKLEDGTSVDANL